MTCTAVRDAALRFAPERRTPREKRLEADRAALIGVLRKALDEFVETRTQRGLLLESLPEALRNEVAGG